MPWCTARASCRRSARTTAQGHELAFATHVLGPFLLTTGLRPLLQADGDGRVVFVSSGGMYTAALETDFEYTQGEYKGVRAYARTKRMQVVLAEQLGAAFTAPNDPVVHSMHPGWVATPGRQRFAYPGFDKIAKPILRSPELGRGHHRLAGRGRRGGAQHRASSGSDRRVRPTHYLPWQHDDPAVRAAAVGYLLQRHRRGRRLTAVAAPLPSESVVRRSGSIG